MKEPLEETKAEIVGSTAVRLEGDRIQCRLRECNTGTLNLQHLCTPMHYAVIFYNIKLGNL